jgi:hypothetical protein
MDESEGSFSIQTIKNYLNACEMLNRKELGLDHLMSSAEAAIEYLHPRGHYFCFYVPEML